MHHGRWKLPWSDPGAGEEGTFFMFWLQFTGTRLSLAAEAKIQSFAPASRCCLGKVGQGQHLCEPFMTFVEWTCSEIISSIFTRLYSPELLGLLPPCPLKSEQPWVFVFHLFGFFWPNKFNFKSGRGNKKDSAVQNQLKIAFLTLNLLLDLPVLGIYFCNNLL